MPEAILSDYFYGDESEQFVFFKIPRQLITDTKFKHISTDAKLLYGMLLDRMSLSAKHGWYDDIDPFIRTLVAGVQLRPRPPDTYAALLRELSAIGNNANQIAYWANARKSISEADIRQAAALVREAWQLVKETL